MQVEIKAGPAFAYGEVTLPPNTSVRVEAGAMAMQQGDVSIATSTQGGFLKGLKRTLGGESFFVNDFSAGAGGGVVGVAAALPGDMVLIDLTQGHTVMVQSGSWVASDSSVDVDASWGGGKTFFSGEGLILLKCAGHGHILVSSYGAILERSLTAGEVVTLDTGHVVAFDDTITYSVRKAGGWKTSILGGEGLVTDFTGPGRIWMQTRSTPDFIAWLTSVLPTARK